MIFAIFCENDSSSLLRASLEQPLAVPPDTRGSASRAAPLNFSNPNKSRKAARFLFFKFGPCGLACINRKWTARVEITSRGRIHRRRRVALQNDAFAPPLFFGIRHRHGRHERFRIRMEWLVDNVSRGAKF